jgi:FkbM family methyltransferase
MTVGNLIRSLIPQRLHDGLFRISCPRVNDDLKHSYASGISMWWSLENLKRCGFCPATVIDVGAFIGQWTQRTRAIWPDAKYLMIEPQPNKQARLRAQCNDRVSLECALLGSAPSDAVHFHMDDFGNSSVLESVQNKCLDAESLPMKTLDSVVAARNLTGPILLKEDVQGYELEVLRGADETLRNTEVVLLEASTLPYNIGAPSFSDVIAFMADRKFLLYDVCEFHRRDSDRVVFQMDVLFVREDSPLRAEKPFFQLPHSEWAFKRPP